MNDLGYVFTVMYDVDLETLDLVIREAYRIRAERQLNAGLEASAVEFLASPFVRSR